MPSPLLCSLVTYDCAAKNSSNIKFVDDTTILGLITFNNKMAYREKVKSQTSWCQDSNLSTSVKLKR